MGTRIVRRSKNHIKVISIVLIVVCLLVGGILGGKYWYSQTKTPKLVHFSIDDATSIFQDITVGDYDSIFENSILNKLRFLHDEYDITVSLYVYEQLEEFAIWEMPTKYKTEFIDNSSWLKIGFHSPTEENPAEVFTEKEYEYEFARTERALWKIVGEKSITYVLRLHYWYATDEMVNYLKSQGVTGLLCSDSENLSYDLTDEQFTKLNKSQDGKLKVNDFTYYVTDLRLENNDDIVEELKQHKKDRIITIFTHAWCFEDNYDKLKEAIVFLKDNDYQFHTLDEMTE